MSVFDFLGGWIETESRKSKAIVDWEICAEVWWPKIHWNAGYCSQISLVTKSSMVIMSICISLLLFKKAINGEDSSFLVDVKLRKWGKLQCFRSCDSSLTFFELFFIEVICVFVFFFRRKVILYLWHWIGNCRMRKR